MKFAKEKIIGLAGPQVHFYEADNKESGFSIIANKRGIRVSGDSPYFENEKDLDAFARGVTDAWAEHLKLKPKLTLNSSGH